MEEELKEQIAFFIEDESYFEKYKSVVPLWDYYLVRLFKFVPKKSKMTTTILVPNSMGEWLPSTGVLDSKAFPLVKVIKVGPDAKRNDIRPGEVYTVPSQEILGDSFNPDYIHMINTFKTPGGKQGSVVNLPDGVPQKIANVEKFWELDMFVLPENYGKLTDEDRLTYLIPSSKFKTRYEFSQHNN